MDDGNNFTIGTCDYVVQFALRLIGSEFFASM